MDPRLLGFYNEELQHVREMGEEFAREFPKIAGRLGLEGLECTDPYVERLLEGFAFLAARVRLKIEASYPRFTQHLLEMVYPHYLAPTPSMMVVQLEPDPGEGALGGGVVVERGSALRSPLPRRQQTACRYVTAHDVTLWPVEIAEARYLARAGEAALPASEPDREVHAALRLRLRSTGGQPFSKLALDRLPLFLRGPDELPMQLYEALVGHGRAVVVQPTARPAPWSEAVVEGGVARVGFEREEALLPHGPRSLDGYRLLQEYFALPQRFLFVELRGLARGLRRCDEREVDLVVLLDRADPHLEPVVDARHFGLYCTPAINLFSKRADRIHLGSHEPEHHVVLDRTRPLDFEVWSVTGVTGYGARGEAEQTFSPLYSADDHFSRDARLAYFTVRREQRLVSSRQQREGTRSRYIGSETFLALVDGTEAAYRSDMRQLAVETLCTNRDLPLHLPIGQGTSDFSLESGAPVRSIRAVAGPTPPRPSHAHGAVAWRLISHLSLNYLSLVDNDERSGAAALRDMLMLYGQGADATVRKQIEGVRAVSSRPIVRRLPLSGPSTFGRGLEITVTLSESAFEGLGVFLLGGILERFFARYVSINSFTETVVRTVERGEIARWPMQIGRRQLV
jgi:type VI secretion system protein ImpG